MQAKRDAAHAKVTAPYPPANVTIRARFPGRAGAGAVTLRMFLSQNRFAKSGAAGTLGSSFDRDVVMVSGLADPAQDGLYRLARDQGVAAVVATHNLELARHMDRVLALKDGHLEPLAMA